MMTQEEYHQLDPSFAHCAGTRCEQAEQCLCHIAHGMLAGNRNFSYTVANPALITGQQPCPLFTPDRRETYAWGISRLFDNVKVADLGHVKRTVMLCLGRAVYYHVKQQRRAITPSEQQSIRRAFTQMGYDGAAIEFDRYEDCYPVLMRMRKEKR